MGSQEGVWQWWVAGGLKHGQAERGQGEGLLRVYPEGEVNGGQGGDGWGEVVELMVGQVADVVVGSSASQHAQLVYEVGQAVSMARLWSPFIDLDKK